MKKAVVLLSGGLDSATVLFWARHNGFKPHCLIFDYGQRHRKEVKRASRIAEYTGCPSQVVKIDLPWRGSSLLDKKVRLKKTGKVGSKKIPATYVPGRNIIFLSFAASFAEVIGARDVFLGANAIDYSGYPDCRPEFFRAFDEALRRGLKAGVEGRAVKICTPLAGKNKAQIVRLGLRLKVPFSLTWSCYVGGKSPCGKCDSCVLRKRGFASLKIDDPLLKA